MQTRIEINMDAKCRRCGKPGAMKGGLCMKCFSKALQKGEFDELLKRSKQTEPKPNVA